MTEKKLSDHVTELRRLSDQLVRHSFPHVDMEEEIDLMPLKCRQIVVDGYDIVVSFNKSQHEKFLLESLHIRSVYTPFLPFTLVCKVARAFLGSEHLSFVSFIRGHKRLYCWSVRRRRSRTRTIPPTKKSIPTSYEGFEYRILQGGPAQI